MFRVLFPYQIITTVISEWCYQTAYMDVIYGSDVHQIASEAAALWCTTVHVCFIVSITFNNIRRDLMCSLSTLSIRCDELFIIIHVYFIIIVICTNIFISHNIFLCNILYTKTINIWEGRNMTSHYLANHNLS